MLGLIAVLERRPDEDVLQQQTRQPRLRFSEQTVRNLVREVIRKGWFVLLLCGGYNQAVKRIYRRALSNIEFANQQSRLLNKI